LKEAAEGIETGPLKVLESKSGEFNRGKSLLALDRKTWLPKQLDHLAGSATSVQQIADQIAKSAEAGPAGNAQGNKPAPSKRSRLDEVEEFMKSADERWLKELTKTANVTRYEFGDKVVPASPSDSAIAVRRTEKEHFLKPPSWTLRCNNSRSTTPRIRSPPRF
jgi:hypothetical protein